MPDAPKPMARQAGDGAALLALARRGNEESQRQLETYSPEELASGARNLPTKQRFELLELADRIGEIVPLLSEAEFTSTVVSVGLADAGWLVEFATPEQRVAAVDLDCWKDRRLSPSRLLEWIDAMIEAGPETLVAAFDELDSETWVVAMKAMGSFTLIGAVETDADADYITDDGTVAYIPHSAEDEHRLREILGTALTYSPSHYWQFVLGAISESAQECAESAAHWHSGRMNDLGFPSREDALRAYRPLTANGTPAVDVGDASAGAEWPPHALAKGVPLPEHLLGTLVGRALAELAEGRAIEILGYVLAVANTLAVADELPLAEPSSVERSLSKALRGIDRGLRELARARNEAPSTVLGHTAPLDLFRVGATLDAKLGRGKTLSLLEQDEEHAADWNRLTEMIDQADMTIAPDGRPR